MIHDFLWREALSPDFSGPDPAKAKSSATALTWGPKDHINTRILHSGPNAQYKGIPEPMVCRILMFLWSFGFLEASGAEIRTRPRSQLRALNPKPSPPYL